MLQNILLVALGAVFGGVARYLVLLYTRDLTQSQGFPYGTLIVNVVGCVFVGYVLTWTADHSHDRWRLLLATGFCGAFTTFSTFAFESMSYWHAGKIGTFLLNLAVTNSLCMLAVVAGIRLHGSR